MFPASSTFSLFLFLLLGFLGVSHKPLVSLWSCHWLHLLMAGGKFYCFTGSFSFDGICSCDLPRRKIGRYLQNIKTILNNHTLTEGLKIQIKLPLEGCGTEVSILTTGWFTMEWSRAPAAFLSGLPVFYGGLQPRQRHELSRLHRHSPLTVINSSLCPVDYGRKSKEMRRRSTDTGSTCCNVTTTN